MGGGLSNRDPEYMRRLAFLMDEAWNAKRSVYVQNEGDENQTDFMKYYLKLAGN